MCFTIKQELPINGQIKEKEVQVIGADGEKVGVLPIDKALELAHKEGRQEYIDLINDIKSQIKVYWENSSLIE